MGRVAAEGAVSVNEFSCWGCGKPAAGVCMRTHEGYSQRVAVRRGMVYGVSPAGMGEPIEYSITGAPAEVPVRERTERRMNRELRAILRECPKCGGRVFPDVLGAWCESCAWVAAPKAAARGNAEYVIIVCSCCGKPFFTPASLSGRVDRCSHCRLRCRHQPGHVREQVGLR